MVDQASELRNLVLRAAREEALPKCPPPRLIVSSGGKGGVGATTLAVNLSLAMVDQGSRVVLVDADVYRSDAAVLCGIEERHNVGDVMAARRDIHEVLVRGPAGLLILPGLWAPSRPVEISAPAQQRLLRQLKSLGRHADIVLLDVGGGPSEALHHFWQSADDVLITTTPDDLAVMDTYAVIKSMSKSLSSVPVDELSPGRPAAADVGGGPPVHLIVNRAGDDATALSVFQRVQLSCRRFLNQPTNYLGRLPADTQIAQAAELGRPFWMRYRQSPAALAVDQLAAKLLQQAPVRRAA